jgi:hypothetical protein
MTHLLGLGYEEVDEEEGDDVETSVGAESSGLTARLGQYEL